MFLRDLGYLHVIEHARRQGNDWQAENLAYMIDLSVPWAGRTLLATGDFLGMGRWTATGAIRALSVGLHWLLALGAVTAAGVSVWVLSGTSLLTGYPRF